MNEQMAANGVSNVWDWMVKHPMVTGFAYACMIVVIMFFACFAAWYAYLTWVERGREPNDMTEMD